MEELSDDESWLELGFGVLAASILAGLLALILGRASGGARRQARFNEAPPSPGSIGSERHSNISSVSAR